MLSEDQNLLERARLDDSGGAAALATVLTHHFGQSLGEADVLQRLQQVSEVRHPAHRGSFSFLDFKRLVQGLGLDGAGYRNLGLRELDVLRPSIFQTVLYGQRHVAVFRGFDGDRALVGDPLYGNAWVPVPELLESWPSRTAFVVRLRAG